ncbi:GGDEF domain-containing phosphodiesterase [Clostridium tarantellae]|uniref:GGDEF domain-containing phosphodiesterase n=1 Tax=Clostridium tarantellae TaxID=39493 RepID=UPI0014782FE9|nr:GGDEF domain-containing phosphodiesterase [Clostridium tarantellae]
MGKKNITRIIDSFIESDRKETIINEEKIKEYEYYIKSSKVDLLTGIYNEYALEDLMDIYKENYTFLFIDINKLKYVNMYYGQLKGDELLKELASYLIDLSKEIKVAFRFCRYESDEFIICIGTTNDCEIKSVIKYLKEFSKKDIICEMNITLRIIAIKNKYNLSLKKLIAYVEYLLEDNSIGLGEDYNNIIQDEKNLYRYYCMAERLNKEVKYLGELGEIYVVFQPQFELKTKSIVGYEVLCRWNHEKIGEIFPKEFLSFFKANNRMYELDIFIFEEALKFQKKLESMKFYQRCSINVSIVTLKNNNFINDISKLIKKYEVDASKITIELIEELALEEKDTIKNLLKNIKDNGMNISIDDFGTGYSSLSRLYLVPFDELKIPREFLMNSLTDGKQLKILKTISNLAKVLNLSTVVEGVETLEQYELIKTLGFNYSQGFFHSKPLKKNEYLIFIKEFS